MNEMWQSLARVLGIVGVVYLGWVIAAQLLWAGWRVHLGGRKLCRRARSYLYRIGVIAEDFSLPTLEAQVAACAAEPEDEAPLEGLREFVRRNGAEARAAVVTLQQQVNAELATASTEEDRARLAGRSRVLLEAERASHVGASENGPVVWGTVTAAWLVLVAINFPLLAQVVGALFPSEAFMMVLPIAGEVSIFGTVLAAALILGATIVMAMHDLKPQWYFVAFGAVYVFAESGLGAYRGWVVSGGQLVPSEGSQLDKVMQYGWVTAGAIAFFVSAVHLVTGGKAVVNFIQPVAWPAARGAVGLALYFGMGFQDEQVRVDVCRQARELLADLSDLKTRAQQAALAAGKLVAPEGGAAALCDQLIAWNGAVDAEWPGSGWAEAQEWLSGRTPQDVCAHVRTAHCSEGRLDAWKAVTRDHARGQLDFVAQVTGLLEEIDRRVGQRARLALEAIEQSLASARAIAAASAPGSASATPPSVDLSAALAMVEARVAVLRPFLSRLEEIVSNPSETRWSAAGAGGSGASPVSLDLALGICHADAETRKELSQELLSQKLVLKDIDSALTIARSKTAAHDQATARVLAERDPQAVAALRVAAADAESRALSLRTVADPLDQALALAEGLVGTLRGRMKEWDAYQERSLAYDRRRTALRASLWPWRRRTAERLIPPDRPRAVGECPAPLDLLPALAGAVSDTQAAAAPAVTGGPDSADRTRRGAEPPPVAPTAPPEGALARPARTAASPQRTGRAGERVVIEHADGRVDTYDADAAAPGSRAGVIGSIPQPPRRAGGSAGRCPECGAALAQDGSGHEDDCGQRAPAAGGV